MLKGILFLLLSINLFALEISIDSAKDEFQKYSTLDLSDEKEFICQEIKDDFDVTTEVICAFSKRPSQNIQNIQNDFFKIDTIIKDDNFFLSIKPIHKIKLIPCIFDLTKDNSLFNAPVSLSNHWLMIAYSEKLPLINKDKHNAKGINFPYYSDKDKLPYVGSLDIKGNPVYIKRVGDVKEYIQIKKYYKNKEYERCLDTARDILIEYPNTLFKAELIYYEIKVYSQLKDYDNVIANAKIYLREYSANENVSEVLALIARAYSYIGLSTDAEYFFDRLFSEHKKSVFAQWGYIYMGEMLESSGSLKKAIEFYKKAMNETSNIDVAATAAYNLAKIKQGVNSKEAAKYIQKIIYAKPSFFIEHQKSANEMMISFADSEDYVSAAAMAEAMINEIDPTYDEYESYLKNIALWLAKTDDKQKALVALNRYIKEFPDGDYIDAIDIAKDSLFFDTPDLNVSARLVEYDKLIELYANDTIANRAVYEKAKLLLELGEFVKILDNKEQLLQLDAQMYPDKEDIVTQAAIGLMKKSLLAKQCKEVLVVSNEYNITLSNKWDDGIYECAMKGADYQLAKSITTKNLKSKDLELRKKWLYRSVQVDFSIGNYSETVGAAKDLVTLIENDKNSEYIDVYRYLFDTYNRLEQKEKLVDAMSKIEEIFGLTYKDIERYVTMVSIGSEKKDDNMVIEYATKVMDLQNSSSSSAQSPYVEFTLFQSYLNIQNYNLALYTIEFLNSVKLKSSQRARQKYLLGNVLAQLWRDDEAKIAYEAAIKADPESAWAKLAKSALKL